MNAIKRACDSVGIVKLAKKIGVSSPTVSQWASGVRPLPAKRVLAVEAATGNQVSRHDLRPDLYPREAWCRCPSCENASLGAKNRQDGAVV